MEAYRLETTLTQNHTLTLHSLPFHAGESVEVIILVKEPVSSTHPAYPLRGLPITYLQPTEPVSQNDWEAVR